MATGSAFGISGYDPIMSSVEGWVNSYFDKKSEKRAYQRQLALMAEQYKYAQRYAENSPSWNVKGLRDAGLNPILAVSNGVSMGATVPSVPSASSYRSPNTSKASFSGSGLLPFDRRMAKQNADAQTLAAQAADKQADAALIKANNDRSRLASDIAKTIAHTQLAKQEFERTEEGGGYKTSIVNDTVRALKQASDLIDNPNSPSTFDGVETYLNVSPSKHEEFMEKMYRERQKEIRSRRNRDYDDKYERMPNVRRSIYR